MPITDTPAIDCHGVTHTGPIREDNQDAVRLCTADELAIVPCHLYAVADGVGGYSHGGVASELALETLFDFFYGEPGTPIARRLRRALERANLQILQEAQRRGVGRMGTTVTAASVQGNRLHLAHVGDSRAYLIRDGRATCLTNDHTMVADLVRMRALSPEQVRTHAQRSVLNRCLGLALFVHPDIGDVELQEGDIAVLCTDGVWSVIEDDEFAELAATMPEAEPLAQQLVHLALERESDDNVSAIVIRVQSLAVAADEREGRESLGLTGRLRSMFFPPR